jgi:hypothetical protein
VEDLATALEVKRSDIRLNPTTQHIEIKVGHSVLATYEPNQRLTGYSRGSTLSRQWTGCSTQAFNRGIVTSNTTGKPIGFCPSMHGTAYKKCTILTTRQLLQLTDEKCTIHVIQGAPSIQTSKQKKTRLAQSIFGCSPFNILYAPAGRWFDHHLLHVQSRSIPQNPIDSRMQV